ncbi:KCNAB2 isoform 14, partial [Pan troglodytes]
YAAGKAEVVLGNIIKKKGWRTFAASQPLWSSLFPSVRGCVWDRSGRAILRVSGPKSVNHPPSSGRDVSHSSGKWSPPAQTGERSPGVMEPKGRRSGAIHPSLPGAYGPFPGQGPHPPWDQLG